MKWLKISIIITRSVAAATNGATSSPPPQAGEGQGGGTQYDRASHPLPTRPPQAGEGADRACGPTDSISPTAFAWTSRAFRKKGHHGLSVHGETARDADRLAGDVGGVIGQQEGDEPGIILRHAESPHRDGPLEPIGDAGAVGAFEKAAENGGVGRARADRIEDHALADEFACEALGQRDDSALAGGVDRLPRGADSSGVGGHVD